MTEPERPDQNAAPRDEVLKAAAQATAQVAADIAEQADAARREPKRRAWAAPLAAVLSLVAIVMWVVFPPHVDTTDPRSPVRVERDLKIEMASLATQIDDWRTEHGALPDSLAETGATSESVQYVKLDATTFELRGSDAGRALTFRSTQPLTDLTAGINVRAATP